MQPAVTGLVVCLAFAGFLQSPARSAATELDQGIRQVGEGDFEGALLTLDGAIRRLVADHGSGKDIGQAYLHLGIAYLGLGQEPLARAKFREALRHDKVLNPSSELFAAKVVRAFAAARKEQESTTRLREEAGKGWKTGGLLVLAGGAAAGGAGAVLGTVVRERDNLPPSTPTIVVTPEGQALWNVTTLTFVGSATDPEGDVLQYDWDFGDGSRGSGASITHLYTREGQYRVTVNVGDGLTKTQAQTGVTVGTVQGIWRPTAPPPFGAVEYRLSPMRPGGQTLCVQPTFPDGIVATNACGSQGIIEHPRRLLFIYGDDPTHLNAVRACQFLFRGEADGSLQTISGTLTAQGGHGQLPCRWDGQSYPLSLRR